MFVIWSGWGILTILYVLIAAICGIFIQSVGGPHAAVIVGTIIAAAANFYTARALLNRSRKELLDPETGATVVLSDRSSLFFIPMRIWTYIIVILGILMEIFVIMGNSGMPSTP